jgi:hypothetical protein
VLYQIDGAGRMGDGTAWRRFAREEEAAAFARRQSLWGNAAEAVREEVPKHLADRWGCSDAKRVRK